MKIIQSPQAKLDLISIWSYSFEHWGENAANFYIDYLVEKMNMLKENPKIGKSRDYIRSGYRSLHIKKHVVYYQLTDEAIKIVRVLHDSMDEKNQLT